jgi:hypothetical protein
LEEEDHKLPDSEIIRNLIRSTGRQLYYPAINITIYGFMNGMLITKIK